MVDELITGCRLKASQCISNGEAQENLSLPVEYKDKCQVHKRVGVFGDMELKGETCSWARFSKVTCQILEGTCQSAVSSWRLGQSPVHNASVFPSLRQPGRCKQTAVWPQARLKKYSII